MNVVGTVNVLEAARAAGAAVVFSSTGGAIYGDVDSAGGGGRAAAAGVAVRMAKLSAEAYVEGWRRVHGLRSVVLRFANVYGPRQSAALEGGVIAIFLERLAAGEETLVFGDGEQTRDFVHVDDVVRALLARRSATAASSTSARGSRRASTGCTSSAARRRRSTRRRGTRRRGSATRAAACSTCRAPASELGWRPKVDLAEGLRATWEAMTPRRSEAAAGETARRGLPRPTRAEHADSLPVAHRCPRRGVVAAAELVVLLVVAGRLVAREAPTRRESRRVEARPQAAAAKPARPSKSRRRPSPTSRAAGSRSSSSTATAARARPAAASSRIEGRGYRISVVGNAPSHDYPSSLVMYRPGFAARGQAARARPRHPARVPLDGMRPAQLHGAHTVVILGA